ncbi:hypothetical protein AAFX19_15630 [Vibrio harveyi]|uniref:hypothetical protein n=1 Tax=Vibrio harveyi TaxID=669 RepID=UPI0009386C4E|nr:hypothetical protein [Vibrio harveyi]APP06742.1 hypothetical protein BG259_16090 [Vibrio harveyi]EKO3867619.1 hypothetical protein [Vibrio harveyi]
MNYANTELEATFKILKSARILANYAQEQGFEAESHNARPTYDHMGAILADSILQAGMNYRNVVKPRVEAILVSYADKKSVSDLVDLIASEGLEKLLNWSHRTKLSRFEKLVTFMMKNQVITANELKERLLDDSFCTSLQRIDGIGPKTVDYMKCLVGIDSIAVDRHIKTFAKEAGLEHHDYDFLRNVFCSAADLLSISRRAFDSWVWNKLSMASSPQQSLF